MSTSDIEMIEQILQNLLLPDNNLRKKAEEDLTVLMQKKESLSICLTKLLLTSINPQIQTYSAIILRKFYYVSDDTISNKAWEDTSPEGKNIIKANLLLALTQVTNFSIRKKIADAITHIFMSLTENEEEWKELLVFTINGFNLEITEANLPTINICLFLLASMYSHAHDQLKEGIPLYIKSFHAYFKSNSLSLKANTVDCLTEMLSCALSKKEAKQYKELVFYILETTLQCFTANDGENLGICLESLQDLADVEPRLLRKSFGDIFILMGKIIENKAIEDHLREVSFEFLIKLIEEMPKIIEKDTEKLTIFIQSIFKYSMEIDSTIDEEWCNPKEEDFIADEFIPETKLDEAASLLDRLLACLDPKTTLNIISNNIIELLKYSDKDWKYKYIAYISIAKIIEHIDDLASIKQMIDMILSDIYNPNIKIQYACLYCIAEISEKHNPDFQNDYHSRVIPELIKVFQGTKILRIQLEVLDALDLFVEHCTDEDTSLYIQSSLDVLFSMFIKNDVECPCSLKEGILDVVNRFIEASEEKFKPFADKCFGILLEYLSKILKDNINRNLIGILFETLATIGPMCPELLNKYFVTLVDTIVQLQLNLSTFKESIAEFLLSTWEKILPFLVNTHKVLIPKIIESLIYLLKKSPEMSIASQPEVKFSIAEFFKDDNEEEKQKKAKADIATSETQEYATFIEILNLFIEGFPEEFINHANDIYTQSIRIIAIPSDEIKTEIAKTFSLLSLALSKANDTPRLHSASKQYISDLIGLVDKETSFTVITGYLDSMIDIIQVTKVFLTTPEINQLGSRLITAFDNIEKLRLTLLKEKDETTKQIDHNKKTGDNKIYSDDEDDEKEEEALIDINDQIEDVEEILTAMSELFGTLFDTHKELTLEIVDKLIKEYLPKYFKSESTIFEKRIGLLIIDDMAEHLGQNLISGIWTDIAKILLTYIDHQDFSLKNAAAYGIGIFAQCTTNNFNLYANDLLDGLVKGLKSYGKITKRIKEEYNASKDNIISGIGKIIKYKGQSIDAKYWIDYWVNLMPLKQDQDEGKLSYGFLMEILNKEPLLVIGDNYKNLGKILIALSAAYNTEFSTEECNKLIEEFIQKIKLTPDMPSVLQNILENTKKGKKQNKLKKLIEK